MEGGAEAVEEGDDDEEVEVEGVEGVEEGDDDEEEEEATAAAAAIRLTS